MRRLITISALAIVLIVGCCVYCGISASLHAEHVLHAALLSVELLNEHLDSRGEWPKSWADLEALPPRERGMYSWPKNSERVQQFVEVDFDVDMNRLAAQLNDEFDAVRPIGPYYPFTDYGVVDQLLATVREHNATR